MNLQIQDLGLCSYKEVWDLQKNTQADRIAGKDQDTLLLVEHTPVYTFGKMLTKIICCSIIQKMYKYLILNGVEI